MGKKRVIVLGGGFGGVYTAMQLEKHFKKSKEWEVVLINRENYFVYQPMLAEVVGGSVDLLDTVSSIRRLLPKTSLYVRDIEKIDTANKKVVLAPKFSHKELELSYDHLVISLGNVTNFQDIAGLHEHAMSFKNLADAVEIRNRVIDAVETAAGETDEDLKRAMLTFVIGGGGYSGVEVCAEVND
ncbi:MAG: FAD-dependent oxidoreductase, partial [Simkaniaceae bacterium]|nr:FAD-dependent oxidoreductase [Simkaniaceae bacterium]